MKAVMYFNNKDNRIVEIPQPILGQREILVKIISCGLCGSDVAEWYRMKSAPLVCGHEAAGEIAQVGNLVHDFKVGQRVFLAPKAPCLTCSFCQKAKYAVCNNPSRYSPGGFSEYVLVPESHLIAGVYPLPDSLSFDHATFVEPLGCVIHAQELARVDVGQTVLVIGAGMSGLLHVKYAKWKGAVVHAIDISEERKQIALRMGADSIHLPEKADVVILSTGALSAIEQAFTTVAKGGSVIFFAVPSPEKQIITPLNEFWQKEISLITSYYCGPPDLREALGLLESKEITVEDLITHHLSLDEIQKGYDLVIEGKNSLKIIIHPQQYLQSLESTASN